MFSRKIRNRSIELDHAGGCRLTHPLCSPTNEFVRTDFPIGSELSRVDNGYELVQTLPRLTEEQAMACQFGRLEISLVVESPLVVLLHRLVDVVPWTHTPYAWPVSTTREHTRTVVEAPWQENRCSEFRLVVRDGGTGRVAARRQCLLDANFSRALHTAIRQQAINLFDGTDYVRAIATMGLGLLKPNVLAEKAVARTIAIG